MKEYRSVICIVTCELLLASIHRKEANAKVVCCFDSAEKKTQDDNWITDTCHEKYFEVIWL